MMKDKRILVTGTRGFVGSRVMERFPHAFGLSGNLLRGDMTSPRDREALIRQIEEAEPEFIFHTAAISDIGTCEKHPDASYQANVLLTLAVTEAAKRTGAHLAAFSSDQVYTGVAERGPYAETLTLPKPANVYAVHKLEAETRGLELYPDAVFLRATWMYDMPLYGTANRGNFLVNTLRAVVTGSPIVCPEGQRRGITYVRQVAEFLADAAMLPGGVYNYGSENPLTTAETAEALLTALGLADRIPLIASGAPRHDLSMSGDTIRKHGIVFDTTAEGFSRCIRDYGLRV